ncbi:hypothetical protein Y032_0357g3373 [Ancylostoma ceylanicum]|nr:hypothetical protein Y032_0357g3373 [Ancylostoma ceylanicum]
MIFDQADLNEMRNVYDIGGKRNKQLCKCHHAKAAYFLLDEIDRAGGLSRCRALTAGGRTTYVNEGNIPQEILDSLNATVKQLDIENVITPRNLATFLNDALVRYFKGSQWYNGNAGSKTVSTVHVMPGSSDASKRIESRKRPAEAIDAIPIHTPQLVGYVKDIISLLVLIMVRPCGSTHLEGDFSNPSEENIQSHKNSSTGGENANCCPNPESESLFDRKIKVEPGLEEQESSNPSVINCHIKVEPPSH